LKLPVEEAIKQNMGIYSYNINLYRSFPSIRDGLKPVARKIIYSMKNLNLYHNRPHRKVANVVGATMSSLYAHGDASIYEALVKMAQNFYMNVPIIDGQGNFGSLQGDMAGAMRYIECRLDKYGEYFLNDIDKNAVNFSPTYDNQEMEPNSLPVALPNLLVNGSYGIGQAYLSSIPSHNINDVIDFTIKIINKEITSLDEIASQLYPDFCTGGIIINKDEIKEAYKKGTGRIILRAKIETKDNELIVTEIPYMTNLANIKEKIQEAVKAQKIEGIIDLRDDTNKKNGIKLIIKLKKNINPSVIENLLYKFTPLQTTFTVSLIATEDLTFRVYNILELFEKWIDYRKSTLKRIFNFKISKIRRRIHIIEGLIIALTNINEVIKIIKSSENKDDAIKNLIKRFKITELQSTSIVEMQLYKLTKLNIKELEQEKINITNELKILKSYFKEKNLNEYIINELKEIKSKYNKEKRKTQLTNIETKIMDDDLIPDMNYILFFSKQGMIKKIPVENLDNRRSYGKLRDGDYITNSLSVSSKDNLLCFTNTGRIFNIKIYEIEEGKLSTIGVNLAKYIDLKDKEEIISFLNLTNEQYLNGEGELIFVTRKGLIKKSSIKSYQKIFKTGIIAIKLNDNDFLVGVKFLDEGNQDRDIIVATKNGMFNLFDTDEVSLSLRISIGMKALTLKDNDEVISFDLINKNYIGVITNKGEIKRIDIKTIDVGKRAAIGKVIIKIKNDELIKVFTMDERDDSIKVITNKKIIDLNFSDFPKLLRSVSGKKIPNIKGGEKVVDVVKL